MIAFRVLFRQILYHIVIFLHGVAFFVLCEVAVLDGIDGAVAAAGHAMCARLTPDRLFIVDFYIVERTELFAFSTARTSIRCKDVLQVPLQRILYYL